MRGRKPKPTHLKIVSGNPGKRAINRSEPAPEGDLCDPPDWFTAGQKKEWAEAIRSAPKGLLKDIDLSLLSVWAVAKDLHRQSSEAVDQEGAIVESPEKGVPMQSPWVAIMNRQAMLMLKCCSEMGFTPSSRSRIQLNPGEKPKSKFGSIDD